MGGWGGGGVGRGGGGGGGGRGGLSAVPTHGPFPEETGRESPSLAIDGKIYIAMRSLVPKCECRFGPPSVAGKPPLPDCVFSTRVSIRQPAFRRCYPARAPRIRPYLTYRWMRRWPRISTSTLRSFGPRYFQIVPIVTRKSQTSRACSHHVTKPEISLLYQGAMRLYYNRNARHRNFARINMVRFSIYR